MPASLSLPSAGGSIGSAIPIEVSRPLSAGARGVVRALTTAGASAAAAAALSMAARPAAAARAICLGVCSAVRERPAGG
eukprot:scaffold29800_cov56-Isochrysis_galbana.AAC.1